jgi:hypothetical protein
MPRSKKNQKTEVSIDAIELLQDQHREVDEDMTLEAYEEHSVVRHLIEKLKQNEADDELFMARVTVLKEMIEPHVEEEEGEYLPKLAKKFGKKKQSTLGMELQEAYDEVTEQLQQDSQGRAPQASRKKTASADMHA